MMEYPGPACEALGITIQDIETTGKFLRREVITNSLVFEIYRHCNRKQYGKFTCANSIISLAQISDDTEAVKSRIQKLVQTREKLRKSKKTKEIEALDKMQFSFPEITKKRDVTASLCPLDDCIQNQASENIKETLEVEGNKQIPFPQVSRAKQNVSVHFFRPWECTSGQGAEEIKDHLEVKASKKTQHLPPEVAHHDENAPRPYCPPQDSIKDHQSMKFTERNTTNSNAKKAEQHLRNTLQHEISKKLKFLKTLDEKVAALKYEIIELKRKRGKYGAKNVKRREERACTRHDHLKATENKLREQSNNMSKKVSLLEAKVTGLERTLKYERRQKSYLMVELRKSRKRLEDNPKHQNLMSKLKEQRRLTKDIVSEQSYLTSTHDECLKTPSTEVDGTFTEDTRECVVQLVSLEVATDKVSPVIDCVLKSLCDYSLTANGQRLPRRPTVVKIVDEAQYLMKSYFAEKMQESHHWGLGRDGTSRKKVKIMDTAVTLSNGDILPLGYKRVAHETAQVICETSAMELKEVANCGTSDDSDDFLSSLLGNLSYFMSDRAANEKAANRLITEWRDDVLQEHQKKEESKKIHQFYCMAHALLGFHDYGSKELQAVQNKLQSEGVFLGRDCKGAFRMWRKEPVHLRVPRHMSELAGPVGDEKSGLMDKWNAQCVVNNVKSRIENYKDNRFNGLFAGSMQVLHHRAHLLSLFDKIEKPNLKVQSLSSDLRDGRVIAIVHAVAIVGAKLTGPYWDMVTGGTIPYLRLHEVIRPMHDRVTSWIENLDAFIDQDEEPVITDHPPHRDELYTASFEMSQEVDVLLFREAVLALLTGIQKCIEKQLVDFLEGGIYSSEPSETDLANTNKSGLNNLPCERHFGSLDSSQRKRRNATLHYHSSILMLKSHGMEMLQWLNTRKDRKILWKVARAKGIDLRSGHQAHDKSQVLKLHEDMGKTKPSKQKAPTQIKDKKVKNRKETEEVTPQMEVDVRIDDWVAVAYENGWFPGQVLQLNHDNSLQIDFLHPAASRGVYRRPSTKDITDVAKAFVFMLIPAPVPVSGGRFYKFEGLTSAETEYNRFAEKLWG